MIVWGPAPAATHEGTERVVRLALRRLRRVTLIANLETRWQEWRHRRRLRREELVLGDAWLARQRAEPSE